MKTGEEFPIFYLSILILSWSFIWLYICVMRYFRRPINVLHYHSKSDLFFFFSVSAVVQAVNTWFFQRFVTWSQWKGVYFTWRTLAFRRVYAGRYGFHAEKVQTVAQLSFPCRIEIRALSKSTTIIGVKDFLTMLRIFLNSLFANYSIVNRSIVINLILLVVCSVEKKVIKCKCWNWKSLAF